MRASGDSTRFGHLSRSQNPTTEEQSASHELLGRTDGHDLEGPHKDRAGFSARLFGQALRESSFLANSTFWGPPVCRGKVKEPTANLLAGSTNGTSSLSKRIGGHTASGCWKPEMRPAAGKNEPARVRPSMTNIRVNTVLDILRELAVEHRGEIRPFRLTLA